MKITRTMDFKKLLPFYPDLGSLIPEDAVMERKTISSATIGKSVTGKGYPAILSTPTVDRDGDIILPQGIVTDYYTGTLLWNHKLTDLPIGRCYDLKSSATEFVGMMDFAENYTFAEDVHSLVKQDMLKGISIGYVPIRVALRGTREFNEIAANYNLDVTDCDRILVKVELIEVSLCAVGVNREAMIAAMATKSFVPSDAAAHEFGLDDPMLRLLQGLAEKVAVLEAAIAPPVEETVEETASVEETVEETASVEETVEETASVEETVEETASVEETEKKPLSFTVIRKGGCVIDSKSIAEKAMALASGKLV